MHLPGETTTSRVRSGARVLTATVVAVALLCGGAPAATGASSTAPGAAGRARAAAAGADAVAAAVAGLQPAPVPLPLAAADLPTEITSLARMLGTPMDRRQVATAVAAARLEQRTQSTLAGLLARLRACTTITHRLLAAVPLEQLAAAPVGATDSGLGACATDLAAERSTGAAHQHHRRRRGRGGAADRRGRRRRLSGQDGDAGRRASGRRGTAG